MKIYQIYFTLQCLFIYVFEIRSLQMMKVFIPSYRFRNENALLECNFQLNRRNDDLNEQENTYIFDTNTENDDKNEALYSVKWYKDNEEFYRYVPRANPPQNSYKVDGIKVDHDESNDKKVLLRGLTLKSSGLYRCEVSAEGPSFASVQGEGRMEIVYIPRGGPYIRGEQSQYQIGDYLNLNCSSGKSHPASLLTWFINDDPVLSAESLINYPEKVDNNSLIVTTTGLNIMIDGRHFLEGLIRIRCVASLSPILWRGDKESIVHRRPALMNDREALLLVRGTAASVQCQLRLILLMVFLIYWHRIT